MFETKTMLPECLMMVGVSFLLIKIPRSCDPTCSQQTGLSLGCSVS